MSRLATIDQDENGVWYAKDVDTWQRIEFRPRFVCHNTLCLAEDKLRPETKADRRTKLARLGDVFNAGHQ